MTAAPGHFAAPFPASSAATAGAADRGGRQCFFLAVISFTSTRKIFISIIYKIYVLDECIQKTFNLILKTEALVDVRRRDIYRCISITRTARE